MGKALGIGLALVILVGAYFFVPSFQTWVKDIWNNTNFNFGNYFALEIIYADGTRKLFEPNMGSLTLIDFDSNKAVASINIKVMFTATFTSTVISYSGTLGYNIIVRDANMVLVKNFGGTGGPEAFSGTTLTSGTATQARSATYTSEVLETAISNFNVKHYFCWEWSNRLSVTLTFSDGTTATKTDASCANMNWAVKRVSAGTFSSLSVSWLPTVT